MLNIVVSSESNNNADATAPTEAEKSHLFDCFNLFSKHKLVRLFVVNSLRK